jgi:hypothetical protein
METKVVIRYETAYPRWPWRIYILDRSPTTGELFPRWEAGAFGTYKEAITYAQKHGWEVWHV